MKSRNVIYRLTVGIAAGLTLAAAQIAGAVTITLDYNGFNPGTNVTIYPAGSFGTPVSVNAAGDAGDTDLTYDFDLTVAGTYTIDLWGNTSNSGDAGGGAGRSSHRIDFVFDGTDIDSVGIGSDKVTGFAANSTLLTLNTVDVYVDPQGYNPPNDANDGYRLQGEVGTTGRIALDDSLSNANGGLAIKLVNGINYMVQYSLDQAGHRSGFNLTGGTVTTSDALLNEGTTVDSSGNPGATHQLVRLNTATINIDTNGLSYAIPFADNRGYLLNSLTPAFDGSVEVLAGDVPSQVSGYRLDMTNRHAFNQHIGFDVDASGNIVSQAPDPDDRVLDITGDTITLRTVAIAIDAVNEVENYNLGFKINQTNPNFSNILTGINGDVELTLMPNLDAAAAVYFMSNSGNLTNDARDSWRIEYDDVLDTFVLATWADAAGTIKVTSEESITLNGSGVVISFVLIPEPASASLLSLCGGVLLLARRKRRNA